MNNQDRKKDSFCSYCGSLFTHTITYPKHCDNCKQYAWGNPIPVAVLVLPIEQNGEIGLIIQQRNIDPEKDKWALTSGYVNHGEGWQEAAARETMEELGLSADKDKFKLYDVVGGKDNSAILVICLYDGLFSATDLISFKPNNEVQAVDIMFEPRELAFPSHTKAANDLLKYVADLYKYGVQAALPR